jgi:hypothetical protein
MSSGLEDRENPSGDGARVEDIVAGYIDRLIAGETLDFDDILAAHSESGDEIVRHLKSYVAIGSNEVSNQPLGTIGGYTIRRQIGRGGMGVVYEAWENSMDRRVALKVLPAGIAADDRAVTRFVREARVAGKLNHPNVVSVYGMGVKEQTPYYAMEFVEGETLAQVIARLKDAPLEEKTPFGFPRSQLLGAGPCLRRRVRRPPARTFKRRHPPGYQALESDP